MLWQVILVLKFSLHGRISCFDKRIIFFNHLNIFFIYLHMFIWIISCHNFMSLQVFDCVCMFFIKNLGKIYNFKWKLYININLGLWLLSQICSILHKCVVNDLLKSNIVYPIFHMCNCFVTYNYPRNSIIIIIYNEICALKYLLGLSFFHGTQKEWH